MAEVEPGLSAEERALRAASLDPKLISPAYEAELKKNVVSFCCTFTNSLILIYRRRRAAFSYFLYTCRSKISLRARW